MSTVIEHQGDNEVKSNLPYRIIPELDENSMTPSQLKMDNLASKMSMFSTRRNVFIAYTIVTMTSFMLLITIDNGPTNIISLFVLNAIAWAISSACVKTEGPMIPVAILANLIIFKYNSGLNKYFIFALGIISIIISCFFAYIKNNFHKDLTTATNLECTRAIWGNAGSHVGANSEFGDAGRIGAEGEKILGEALEKLSSKYPHVRIFNGVKFIPFSEKPYDIDHVAIIADRVYFIDSKFWGKGSYSWDRNDKGEGIILKNNQYWKPGEVHMDGAMEHWLRYLNDVELYSRITLTNPARGGANYTVDNRNAPTGQAVIPTKELINELSTIAENSEKIVNRDLIYLFKNNLHNESKDS